MTTNCRSCGQLTEHVLSLGEMPLANRLLEYPSESYKKYPLDLMFCPSCKLGQLKEMLNPELLFDDYVYYSSVNGPTVKAAEILVEEIVNQRGPFGQSPVMEIGSNDGYLLSSYQCRGINVLGIDPARGPANVAAMKGIPTVQDYFTLKLAKTLPKADVIHAHNVLAHVQDLNDFVAGIAVMLKPEGVAVVEVPAMEDMIEKCAFDQVYAEHNYYFTLQSLTRLFYKHELFVEHYENIPAHGGSFRLLLRSKVEHPVYALTEGLDLKNFQMRVECIKKSLANFIQSAGVQVWGFGAAAKATVLLNYCGITNDWMPFVCDDTPAKQGKFIPGTGQKVVPVEEWLRVQPEWTCILAWNYEKEIAEKFKDSYKGTFFTPYHLPTIKGAAK